MPHFLKKFFATLQECGFFYLYNLNQFHQSLTFLVANIFVSISSNHEHELRPHVAKKKIPYIDDDGNRFVIKNTYITNCGMKK